MPSKTQVKTVLFGDDYPLFIKAVEKYGTTEPELLREIIHAWLFSNKLSLLEKK